MDADFLPSILSRCTKSARNIGVSGGIWSLVTAVKALGPIVSLLKLRNTDGYLKRFQRASYHMVGANVMVDHPRREADRGIGDSVKSLRAVAHLDGITQPVLVEINELIPRMFIRQSPIASQSSLNRSWRQFGRVSRSSSLNLLKSWLSSSASPDPCVP
jgi:hypothetical protein